MRRSAGFELVLSPGGDHEIIHARTPSAIAIFPALPYLPVMKRYYVWRETLREPNKMLVDLLVNGVAAAIVYIVYMMIFDDRKINIYRLTLGSLIFSLFMTRSLKWRNIKGLFHQEPK